MIGTEDTSEQNHHYPESTRSRQPHQTAIRRPVVMTRLRCINVMFFFSRRSHCLRVSHFLPADTLALSCNLNADTWQIQISSLIKFNLCACLHPWCSADQTSTSSAARWRMRNLTDVFFTWLYQSMGVDHPIIPERIPSGSRINLSLWWCDVRYPLELIQKWLTYIDAWSVLLPVLDTATAHRDTERETRVIDHVRGKYQKVPETGCKRRRVMKT